MVEVSGHNDLNLASINEVSGCSRNRGSSISALKSAAYFSGIDATASPMMGEVIDCPAQKI
jgi:hypothetical protein